MESGNIMGKYFENKELDGLWARLVTATDKLSNTQGGSADGFLYKNVTLKGWNTYDYSTDAVTSGHCIPFDPRDYPNGTIIEIYDEQGSLRTSHTINISYGDPYINEYIGTDLLIGMDYDAWGSNGIYYDSEVDTVISVKVVQNNDSPEGDKTTGAGGLIDIHKKVLAKSGLTRGNPPKTFADYMKGIAVAARYMYHNPPSVEEAIPGPSGLHDIVFMLEAIASGGVIPTPPPSTEYIFTLSDDLVVSCNNPVYTTVSDIIIRVYKDGEFFAQVAGASGKVPFDLLEAANAEWVWDDLMTKTFHSGTYQVHVVGYDANGNEVSGTTNSVYYFNSEDAVIPNIHIESRDIVVGNLGDIINQSSARPYSCNVLVHTYDERIVWCMNNTIEDLASNGGCISIYDVISSCSDEVTESEIKSFQFVYEYEQYGIDALFAYSNIVSAEGWEDIDIPTPSIERARPYDYVKLTNRYDYESTSEEYSVEWYVNDTLVTTRSVYDDYGFDEIENYFGEIETYGKYVVKAKIVTSSGQTTEFSNPYTIGRLTSTSQNIDPYEDSLWLDGYYIEKPVVSRVSGRRVQVTLPTTAIRPEFAHVYINGNLVYTHTITDSARSLVINLPSDAPAGVMIIKFERNGVYSASSDPTEVLITERITVNNNDGILEMWSVYPNTTFYIDFKDPYDNVMYTTTVDSSNVLSDQSIALYNLHSCDYAHTGTQVTVKISVSSGEYEETIYLDDYYEYVSDRAGSLTEGGEFSCDEGETYYILRCCYGNTGSWYDQYSDTTYEGGADLSDYMTNGELYYVIYTRYDIGKDSVTFATNFVKYDEYAADIPEIEAYLSNEGEFIFNATPDWLRFTLEYLDGDVWITKYLQPTTDVYETSYYLSEYMTAPGEYRVSATFIYGDELDGRAYEVVTDTVIIVSSVDYGINSVWVNDAHDVEINYLDGYWPDRIDIMLYDVDNNFITSTTLYNDLDCFRLDRLDIPFGLQASCYLQVTATWSNGYKATNRSNDFMYSDDRTPELTYEISDSGNLIMECPGADCYDVSIRCYPNVESFRVFSSGVGASTSYNLNRLDSFADYRGQEVTIEIVARNDSNGGNALASAEFSVVWAWGAKITYSLDYETGDLFIDCDASVTTYQISAYMDGSFAHSTSIPGVENHINLIEEFGQYLHYEREVRFVVWAYTSAGTHSIEFNVTWMWTNTNYDFTISITEEPDDAYIECLGNEGITSYRFSIRGEHGESYGQYPVEAIDGKCYVGFKSYLLATTSALRYDYEYTVNVYAYNANGELVSNKDIAFRWHVYNNYQGDPSINYAENGTIYLNNYTDREYLCRIEYWMADMGESGELQYEYQDVYSSDGVVQMDYFEGTYMSGFTISIMWDADNEAWTNGTGFIMSY